MKPNIADSLLLQTVDYHLNTGTKQVVIPGKLAMMASKEAMKEAGRMCKLAGAEIAVSM
jgi:hypothetical protein